MLLESVPTAPTVSRAGAKPKRPLRRTARRSSGRPSVLPEETVKGPRTAADSGLQTASAPAGRALRCTEEQ